MSANLKDSNLQMLAVSSEMFAHSQHELPVCGLPLHCPYITYYRKDCNTARFVKYINISLIVGKHICSAREDGRDGLLFFSFFFFSK